MIGEEVISAAARAMPRGRGWGEVEGGRVEGGGNRHERKMVIDSKLTFRAEGNCGGFPISNKGWKSQIRMKTPPNC